MDSSAFLIANTLVGNQPEMAALEISFPAPQLEFSKESVITVCGGDFSPEINGTSLSMWSPKPIHRGDILSFKGLRSGRFAYIAISGGIRSESILGSAGAIPALPSNEGPAARLGKGDRLEVGDGFTDVIGSVSAAISIRPHYSSAPTLRMLKGPEWQILDAGSTESFEEMDFCVTNTSDRMGYRLSGSLGRASASDHMLSSPVTFGTVQLPPDGNPIVLMADHQTTGGYPRIGAVLMTDLPLLAQLQPRMKLGFKIVDEYHARELLEERNKDLKMLSMACKSVLR
jgi:antagonist of KipI